MLVFQDLCFLPWDPCCAVIVSIKYISLVYVDTQIKDISRMFIFLNI